MDWNLAKKHLMNCANVALDGGSLGINLYMREIFPLLKRYNNNERTMELYKEIFAVELFAF